MTIPTTPEPESKPATHAHSPASGPHRRRIPFGWLIGVGTVLVAVVGIAVIPDATTSSIVQDVSSPPHVVTRGDLVVTVTEEGVVESARNTEIKCEIRGGYGGRGGRSTVNWVIENGTHVNEGDEIVRLETKELEETVSLGKTDTNQAKAALARTKADVAIAQVGADGYLKGQFRSEIQGLEQQLTSARRNLKVARNQYNEQYKMFTRGFVNNQQIEALGFTVTQAELQLQVAQTRIDVHRRLTREMQLTTLNSQLTATQARLKGRTAGVELEEGRLKLAEEEYKKCIIRAPRSGLVIYPSSAKWKKAPDVAAGVTVHNHQVLLLMPDLDKMQVKIEVHESVVKRVQAGQPVRVTLPDKVLESSVHQVAEVARPAGWWTGNVVRYDTTVLLPQAEELKPGMTAQVQVEIARYEDVLTVPHSAVVETDDGPHCWVQSARGPERRKLTLGDSNQSLIEVQDGVAEGDVVITFPLDTVADARELVGDSLLAKVTRQPLLVSLTEQGALESANNTQIKCRVRGRSTINFVVENGVQVKKGDELVRLENKEIEDFLHERTKYAHLSLDAAIGFRSTAKVAGIRVKQYLEGQFVTEVKAKEKELAVANQELKTASSKRDFQQELFDRGYTSELALIRSQQRVQRARTNLAITQSQLDVLNNYRKKEQLAALDGEWTAAKAAANGHEEVLKMDKERMNLAVKEIARCIITAPQDGLVIYPSTASWKGTPDIAEGNTVHNDQVMLLMPDLTRMQVKLGVHETVVKKIKAGMRAIIRLPDRTIDGKVSSVASTARPAGWWTGNLVKYDTLIELPNEKGLKPGMSAEVRIIVNEVVDALTVPASAVVETTDAAYCWVQTSQGPAERKITVGERNDESIAVTAGLNEGDVVLRDPRLSVSEARERIAANSTER